MQFYGLPIMRRATPPRRQEEPGPSPATATLSLGGNYPEPVSSHGECTLGWTQSFGTETLGKL